MVQWIIDNSEWLFSGIAVAVPLAIIGWLWGTRGKGDTNIGSHNRAGKNQRIKIDTTERDKTVKD
jgi:hypothetical protein